MVDCKDNTALCVDSEEPYIGEEERIRHDALFFSQNPDDSLLLSGERARSLFIKSKLPLQDLSKIWKLADVTRDNMLDECEFAVAVHLIQRRLCGFDIPELIPLECRPAPRPLLIIKQASDEELDAYSVVYNWLSPEEKGILKSETVLKFLGSSDLPAEVLSKIWDLSDIDRDGKINKDEFFIALHITRFCVSGKSKLTESIDVLSILPKKTSGESIHDKRRRRTEIQTDMRKLTSLKEKLQTELANAETNENEAAKAKIQAELQKTSKELENIVKKESGLRKEITQMNLQTSVTTDIEVMRPFDRSFLMKRQSCGADFLKQLNYKSGQCRFSENVTPEIFTGENIFDFAKNLPENPNVATKRRGSDSPPKESSKVNQTEEHPSKAHSNEDSDSSDDESDSVDTGVRRRRKNRPKSERNKVARRDPVTERRVRSLSEAIKDIAARNEAAKKEMDVRMIRHSGSDKSSEGSTTESSVSSDGKQGKKKDAVRRRSKGAMELFHKLFSSDSETASDRESPTKRRSIKALQKSPWNERKEINKQSSSDNEKTGRIRKNVENRQGPKELGVENSRNIALSKAVEKDTVISPVEKKENSYDFQQTFDLIDKLTKVNGESKGKRLTKESDKSSNESESEKVLKKSRSVKNNYKKEADVGQDDCNELSTLILKPVSVSGVNEAFTFGVDSDDSHVEKKAYAGKRGRAVEEEAVAPIAVSVDERVRNLIDLLDETSCDTVEEERFRRKLSKIENKGIEFSSSESGQVTPHSGSDIECSGNNIYNNGKGKSGGKLFEGNLIKPGMASSPIQNHHNSNDDTGDTSGGNTSDGGNLDGSSKTTDINKDSAEESNASPTTKKRKVLRTKSGHIVRSKSMYGLKSRSDPNRLSYVDECEWLDTLVQIELDTIEKRKRAEEEASLSPTVESKPRPPIYSRSETIDEASLNLYDSRHLVKTLLDMELEGRKTKEEGVKLREGTRYKDKEALDRRRSMPVGKDILEAAEERRMREEDHRIKAESITPNDELKPLKGIDAKDRADTIGTVSKTKDNVTGQGKEVTTGRNNVSSGLLPNSDVVVDREEKSSKERGSQVSPVRHDTPAKQAELSSENKLTSTTDTQKDADAKHTHVKKLHRQSSTEDDNKPLKSIKAFKEMFEEKSSLERPVDSYSRSFSVDESPERLTRSKSLAEGLNRPAEDSKHIKVVEKQQSVEKTDQRLLNERNKSRDIVFFEEAKRERERSESIDEEKKRKLKRGDQVEGTVNTINNDEIEATPIAVDEEVPHFKNIGAFKQLFEKGQAPEGNASKKRIAIVKKDSTPENASENIENIEVSRKVGIEKTREKSGLDKSTAEIVSEKKVPSRSAGKSEQKHIQKEQEPKVHGSTIANRGSQEKMKEKKQDDYESRAEKDQEEVQHNEDSIPSIKGKLAMFQTSFNQDDVKRREPKIRKIRPKSFHGNAFHDDSENEDSISKSSREPNREDAGFKLGKNRDKIGTNAESVRNVGEWVLHGTTDSTTKFSKETVGKQETKADANQKKVLSKSVSQDAFVKPRADSQNEPPNSQRIEHHETDKIPENDESWEAFSYSKVVKDERIRRELEEQEARERKIRHRALSSSGQKSEHNDVQKEQEPKVNGTKVANQGGQEKTTENHDSESNVVNGSLDYLAYAKSDRIRKEIEEEQRREMEVKQHLIGNMGSSKKEDLNSSKLINEVSKEPVVNGFKMKDNIILRNSDKEASSLEETNKPDTNGNFESNESIEKSKVTRESAKSRKMPSRIEIELEEERRREKELEDERKKREEERARMLNEEKRKLELVEAEKKRIEEEEFAKQNAIQEEKLKRQARTRGLRAMFETS
ncbi:uncharacterized protein LOC135694496 [Rhopilema esculentum]|uniref:uncharacterized protein LOC135694496 n=1 Tax=Rhopilema esculentum TaxID=499914 RepID=UPI0031D5C6E5|eukprot:gene4402-20628_t